MTRPTSVPTKVTRWIGLALLLFVSSLATAQSTRIAECITANDEVTRHRLGKDRAGNRHPVNVSRAVVVGQSAATRCQGDDFFLLAFAMARIDMAKDVKRSSVENRTALFNGALGDLELIKRRVLAGKSDRYEIFNSLGLIYYETKQYEKSIIVLKEASSVFQKMTARSKQNTLFTRGMAEFQLGRFGQATASFEQAKKYGHPHGARWEVAMRKRL